MLSELNDKFSYVYSSSVQHNVQIKIGTLDGQRIKSTYEELLADPMLRFSGLYMEQYPDLSVHCQILSAGVPLLLPIISSYKHFTRRWDWNEWITFGCHYNELPRNAVLALTIYDCGGAGKLLPVGGTTITLFGKHGVFRQGLLDLKVWRNRIADGNWPSTTPGKTQEKGTDQMQRLTKFVKKHKNGEIAKIDWLDRHTFREIEGINARERNQSDFMYLTIQFPIIVIDNIQYSLVYYEEEGDDIYPYRAEPDLVTVPDAEILQDNLVESKHHKLSRSLRSGISDRDAKPNSSVRDQLNNIVRYPPTKQLSSEEQDLVWKFRFYLRSQKEALTKFLKCVNWNVAGEVRQALELLPQWSPMDVEDALELLSPNFTHPAVRRYAISRLQQAPDEDLLLYLLQLVQALKYENFEEILDAYDRISPQAAKAMPSEDSTREQISRNELNKEKNLASIELKRSGSFTPAEQIGSSSTGSVIEVQQNIPLLTNSSPTIQHVSTSYIQEPQTSLSSANSQMQLSQSSSHTDGSANTDTLLMTEAIGCDLASFLISKACVNSTLANYLYWYLMIECEDQDSNMQQQDGKVREMYLTVLKTFSISLTKGTAELQRRRSFLTAQQSFIDKLVKLIKTVARESGNRKKKTEKLQQLLSDSDAFKINFVNFDPIPLPLDPDIIIKGIIPEKATLFKSALMPSRLTFMTTENVQYVAIFKHGDDLRQDQLILQMITLMDKLLRREKLDLKLTPYRVLATSTKHGFVQFIDSLTVAEVLQSEGSILAFFRKHHPHETAPYGVVPEIMDTYIRSCAGYCVITYLLGVGDRHLDNLLLTTSGKLFHIDFGYILGRDPKPLPPPMKLSKEMVDGMGGNDSEHYQEFRTQVYTAFLHLRRHANLMLNLFSLMVDASVPDIALEPDKAVKKVQDKLCLELGDEEAVVYIQRLLDESMSSVMPAIVDHLHKFAQYIRK